MKKEKISQPQFETIIEKSEHESQKGFRSQLYPMALDLLKKGREIEAYLLILATWNFAGFRYIRNITGSSLAA